MNGKPSSPTCYGAEADDVYMGYACRDEILTALNELLEAERAGAKVALASRGESAKGGAYARLMGAVRADEARWCAMLSRQIERLEGRPSRRTGTFQEKALAIPDLLERLAFLNRGQAWVVRKLEELLPRVRDDALHGDLREMLASHRENIARAQALLDSAAGNAAKA
ncbi:MAG: DUF6306 domain-containing protein [Novosphingobium sp.]|nr:DUF6306 domain-containing protein [Novosphingobium sp.]